MDCGNSKFSGRIRPPKQDDLAIVSDFVAQLATHHGDIATVMPEELARDILGPHPWVRVLLAESQDRCVGYAALCPLSKMQFGLRGMDLMHLYVVPGARRMGVAKALITAGQDLARREGCHYFAVGTHPDNKVAQDIYLALGFDLLDAPGPRYSLDLRSQA